MKWHEMQSRLRGLAEESRELGLPEADVRGVLQHAESGEYELAVDDLCSQLYEFSIPVTAAFVAEVSVLRTEMNLNGELWGDLTVA